MLMAVIECGMELVIHLGELAEHFEAEPDVSVKGRLKLLTVNTANHQRFEGVGFAAQFAADFVVRDAQAQLVL